VPLPNPRIKKLCLLLIEQLLKLLLDFMNGTEIRNIRDSLRLTQAQFAALLGVHAVTISRWEIGAQSPTPYQDGLIQRFGIASKRRSTADEIAMVLVTAGAIAGLFFLLQGALTKEEEVTTSRAPERMTRRTGRKPAR
jgi:DNA-binding transcriptional regulator YiaG